MSGEKNVEAKEKDLVVKLEPSSRVFAQSVLNQINAGDQFKRKMNFKDLFDHLLKKYGEKAVPELMKMREQPEDKLKLRYQKSGTDLEYNDWLVQQLSKLDAVEKRSTKKKKTEDVSVN